MELFSILFGAIFVNNFVLTRFLGICPFLGVSKRIETSMGMGMAVIFVMTIASILTWSVYHWILVPMEIQFMQTVAFILIIASLVQFVEMFIEKVSPSLYQSLGIFLPLITTNCAILGLTLINVQQGYTLIQTAVHGVGAGIGFTVALILIAGIRERLEFVHMNEFFKGASSALVVAGILSIAFMGFQGVM